MADSHLLIYGRFQNENQFKTVVLIRVDTLGDSLRFTPLLDQKGEDMAFNDYRVLNGEQLYLSHRDACLNRDNLKLGNQIYALNDQQQIDWQSPTILFSFSPFLPFESITPVGKDTVILANPYQIASYDIGERDVIAKADDLQGLKHVLPKSDTSFVVIDSVHLLEYNMNCELVFNNRLDYPPIDVSWRDRFKSSFLSIGRQKVTAFNDKGIPFISYGWEGFKDHFDSLSAIHWLRDSLFLSGYQNGDLKLGYINRFFYVDQSIVLGPADYELKDIKWSGEDIFYLLSDTNKQHDLLGRARMDQFFSPVMPDLSLEVLEVDTIYPNFNSNGLLNPEFELSLTVTNTGDETIESFYLNWRNIMDSSCAFDRFSRQYKRALAPGQKSEITLSIRDTLREPESPYQLCFSVSSPNGLVDTNLVNDSACYWVTLPKTGINEYTFKLPAVPSVIKAGKEISLPSDVRFTALYFMDGRQATPSVSSTKLGAPGGCKQGSYIAAFTYQGLPFRKVVLVAP